MSGRQKLEAELRAYLAEVRRTDSTTKLLAVVPPEIIEA
jgi:hypothetical protein